MDNIGILIFMEFKDSVIELNLLLQNIVVFWLQNIKTKLIFRT